MARARHARRFSWSTGPPGTIIAAISSRDSTMNPVTPGSTSSGTLPLANATTGHPDSIASIRISPKGAGAEAGVDPVGALAALGDAGITQVLVEGGAQLAGSLLRGGLVDRIAWFHAPAVMGGDAWPAVQAFGIERLEAMPRFTRVGETPLGDDMLTEFVRKVD